MEEKSNNIIITEAFIKEKIADYLPSNFPKGPIGVKISKNNCITTSIKANKSDVEKVIGIKLGFKEKLMLGMLPQSFGIAMTFKVGMDVENAMLIFECKELNINGMSLNGDMIPHDVIKIVSKSVNNILIDSGYYYTDIKFNDGELELLA